MIFFYQKSESENMIFIKTGLYNGLVFKNIKDGVQPSFDQIYLLPPNGFNNHLSYIQSAHPDTQLYNVPIDVLKESVNFLPCMIGKTEKDTEESKLFRDDLDTVEAITAVYKKSKKKQSIAIYHSQRTTIGKTLAQASVLKNLYDQLIANDVDCEFVSYKPMSDQDADVLYRDLFPELKQRYLPVSAAEFFNADFILTDSFIKDDFETDLHDLYAKQFCFNLSDNFQIKEAMSTDFNVVRRAENIYKSRFDNKLPTIVFNKESLLNNQRMPDEIAESLLLKLLDAGKFNIVSFDRLSFLNISHERYQVFTEYTHNLRDYINFLKASNGLISVDSGAVHLASRMGMDTFTIYSSNNKKNRSKYYVNNTTFEINEQSEEKSNTDWQSIDLDKLSKQMIKKFKKSIF